MSKNHSSHRLEPGVLQSLTRFCKYHNLGSEACAVPLTHKQPNFTLSQNATVFNTFLCKWSQKDMRCVSICSVISNFLDEKIEFLSVLVGFIKNTRAAPKFGSHRQRLLSKCWVDTFKLSCLMDPWPKVGCSNDEIMGASMPHGWRSLDTYSLTCRKSHFV